MREFLGNTFDTWFGRSTEWPPRSPDLTPCDFAVWAMIKEKIYKTKPRCPQQLKERITAGFDNFKNDHELRRRICHSVSKRCQLCLRRRRRSF